MIERLCVYTPDGQEPWMEIKGICGRRILGKQIIFTREKLSRRNLFVFCPIRYLEFYLLSFLQ